MNPFSLVKLRTSLRRKQPVLTPVDRVRLILYTDSMKIKLFFIAALSVLTSILATNATAQNNAVSAAMNIVEVFYSEADTLSTRLPVDAAANIKKSLLAKKTETLSDIQSINVTETPGKRRYYRIKNTVDAYTESVIALFAGLDDNATERLIALKAGTDKQMTDTFKLETYEKEPIRPVPSIDSSPYEKGTNQPANIWDR